MRPFCMKTNPTEFGHYSLSLVKHRRHQTQPRPISEDSPTRGSPSQSSTNNFTSAFFSATVTTQGHPLGPSAFHQHDHQSHAQAITGLTRPVAKNLDQNPYKASQMQPDHAYQPLLLAITRPQDLSSTEPSPCNSRSTLKPDQHWTIETLLHLPS